MKRSSLDGFFNDINTILKEKLHHKNDLTRQEERRLFRFLKLYQNCPDENGHLCQPKRCGFAKKLGWVINIDGSKADTLCDLIDDYLKKDFRPEPNPVTTVKPKRIGKTRLLVVRASDRWMKRLERKAEILSNRAEEDVTVSDIVREAVRKCYRIKEA